MNDTLQALVDFYETLTPDSVAQIGSLYSPDAHFKDPFNEVYGVPAIERIFTHMFDQVEAPRFVVTGRFTGTQGAMLLWDFHFRTRGLGARPMTIRGASHLQFAADGRVCDHRDYWDVAEELYARLPLLGGLMHWLQRRGRA